MPGRAEYRNRNEVQSDKKLPPDRFILAAITDKPTRTRTFFPAHTGSALFKYNIYGFKGIMDVTEIYCPGNDGYHSKDNRIYF